MKHIKKLLVILGFIFIAQSLIFAATQIKTLADEREDARYWAEAADENWDNSLIEEKANIEQEKFRTHLVSTGYWVLASIAIALIFIGIARIIELLEDIRNRTEEKLYEIKEKSILEIQQTNKLQ